MKRGCGEADLEISLLGTRREREGDRERDRALCLQQATEGAFLIKFIQNVSVLSLGFKPDSFSIKEEY